MNRCWPRSPPILRPTDSDMPFSITRRERKVLTILVALFALGLLGLLLL